MKSEQILKCIGNVEERFIEEAADMETGRCVSKKSRRKSAWKALSAACLAVCLLFGAGVALAKTFGIHILQFVSTEEESGYDMEFKIEKVPNAIFIGEVREAHEIIRRQYESYEPHMSWYPGSYSKSFRSVQAAIRYLGVDFIEHPLTDEAEAVELMIEGDADGEFESITVMADYKIDGMRVSIASSVYTDQSNVPSNTVGKSVLDGSAFDQGYHAFSEEAADASSAYTSVRAGEYETYTSARHLTQNGTEALILQASPNENGFVTLDGYFVKGKVFYAVYIAAEESRADGGLELLENILGQY